MIYWCKSILLLSYSVKSDESICSSLFLLRDFMYLLILKCVYSSWSQFTVCLVFLTSCGFVKLTIIKVRWSPFNNPPCANPGLCDSPVGSNMLGGLGAVSQPRSSRKSHFPNHTQVALSTGSWKSYLTVWLTEAICLFGAFFSWLTLGNGQTLFCVVFIHKASSVTCVDDIND